MDVSVSLMGSLYALLYIHISLDALCLPIESKDCHLKTQDFITKLMSRNI